MGLRFDRDGAEISSPADQVRVGDIVVVRSGGRIPVDGAVLEGRASVDRRGCHELQLCICC